MSALEQSIEDIVRRVMREEIAAHFSGATRKLLTTDEVAKMLGFTNRRGVYTLKRERKLEAVVLGKNSLRFRHEEVERFIREREG